LHTAEHQEWSYHNAIGERKSSDADNQN